MKGLKEFQIPFVGLKIGVHEFNYNLNKSFFEHFPDSPIGNCEVNVKLEFDKKETLFVLNFFIDGKVAVECDRCLAPYEKEIFGDYTCYVKLLGNPDADAEDDEIIFIGKDESHIDVAQLIYEYVVLCLPIQKIPCAEPGKDERCNQAVLKYLNQQEQKSHNEQAFDPRWEALKKLNKN
ncbi:MAG: DUF177 domain-containing protein [Chitinophagales bacterium]|nr:DUF177 domain-containing protein [Chitinophagales bacterium]OJV27811.1 MAG: hypothetical protein BGO32_10915 [Bacteroidetes bacterium 37-13]HRP38474.1 DUF177 domain-containing protein [Chitinophagales bacterium]